MPQLQHCKGSARLSISLLVALQVVGVPGGVAVAQGPGPEIPSQLDAWIDSVSLVSIGEDDVDPLYLVVGAVFHGDTLIIAENSTGMLRYYDRATGRLHRTVGGTGEGPGEYQALVFLQVVGDRIHTFDLVASRVTIMDLAGVVERTVRIAPTSRHMAPQVLGFFPDGAMLVAGFSRDWTNVARVPTIRRDPWVLSRHDEMGNFIDSLGWYLGKEFYVVPYGRDGEAMPEWPVPFARLSMVGVFGDNYYVADNMEPRIPLFDQEGNLRDELDVEISPEPQRVTREDARRFREADEVDRQPPEFYPFLGEARNVSGRLWVRHYGSGESDVHTWTVLSSDGDIVGRVRSLDRLVVLAVDGDTAAVVRVDDLGVETVELRRILEWR